jgi:hypothetical protein
MAWVSWPGCAEDYSLGPDMASSFLDRAAVVAKPVPVCTEHASLPHSQPPAVNASVTNVSSTQSLASFRQSSVAASSAREATPGQLSASPPPGSSIACLIMIIFLVAATPEA